MSISPTAILVQELNSLRRNGVAWEVAWPLATRAALGVSCDPEWADVLADHEEVWRAAYLRLDVPRAARSMGLLGEDGDPVVEPCHQPRGRRPALAS